MHFSQLRVVNLATKPTVDFLPQVTSPSICLFLFLSYLRVEGKRVESHRAYEGDMRGLRVHDVFTSRDPEPGVFAQHLDHLESLEIVDENVGQPELVDELEVHRDHRRLVDVAHVENVVEERVGDSQSRLLPKHVEI